MSRSLNSPRSSRSDSPRSQWRPFLLAGPVAVGGVVVGRLVASFPAAVVLIATGGLLVLTGLLWLCRRESESRRFVTAVAVTVGLVLLAGYRSRIEERSIESLEARVAQLYYQEIEGGGRVVSDPQPYFGGERFVLSLDRIEPERSRPPTRARVLVSTSTPAGARLGDALRIVGVLAPPAPTVAGYQKRRHTVAVVHAKLVEVRAPPSRLLSFSNALRERLSKAVSVALPKEEAALMLGLLIGDDFSLPYSRKEEFRKSGLSHLTAVSGHNFSAVLAMAAFVFDSVERAARKEKFSSIRKRSRSGASVSLERLETRGRSRLRTALLMTVVAFFGVLTRWEPSVLRAAAMAMVGLGRSAAGMRIEALESLSLSVALLVAIDPFLVDLAGFQLSVAATAGILHSGLSWAKSWERVFRRCLGRGILAPFFGKIAGMFAGLAAICLAAQLYVAPVIFWRFGSFQPSGAISNLIAVPLAEAASLLGFGMALPAAALPELLGKFFVLLGPMLSALIFSAEAFAKTPQIEVTMSEFSRGIFSSLLCAFIAVIHLAGKAAKGVRRHRA